MNLRTLIVSTVLTALSITCSSWGQFQHPSKVNIAFNKFYDYAEMTKLLHELVDAYPDLLSIESIGQSVGGREIWLVKLNNPKTGSDKEKTAMFIDGNIHGNELQSAEVVLYTIWYLTKSYGKIRKITELVDERSFYFVPMENPDGRDYWFHQPATPHMLRGGIMPTDNDHDGEYDEDGPDDLDGDGHLTTMWIKDPLGRYERDPEDDRFFRRVGRGEEPGGWTRLGQEGIDNDGDGMVNEDGIGGYDPNRNWPSDWQPEHVQRGAGEYPTSLPETRAVVDFLLEHPNIAGYQAYHNSGGMILRGPSAEYLTYPSGDVRVMEALQEIGARQLPYYDPMVSWKDLYTVHGGEDGWAYEGLGIVAFTNELWTNKKMFQDGNDPSTEEMREFRDRMQFEEVYVPLHEVEHPKYGTILVGGTKKWASRVPPPWLLEEDLHRNFAFTMLHADEMPKVEFGAVQIRERPNGLWELTVEVKNDKIIPTILQIARNKKIGARDSICVTSTTGATVAASGTVNSMLPYTKMDASETPKPECLWNDAGIGSKGSELFRFLIEGQGSVDVTYTSEKGGTINKTITLEAVEPAHPDDAKEKN